MGKNGRAIKRDREELDELREVVNSLNKSSFYRIGTADSYFEANLTKEELIKLAFDILGLAVGRG